MRIIFGNKYYYLKGGAERHLFDLQRILEENGHEVIPFAMADARNVKTDWSRYFVSPVKTEKVRLSLGGLKTAGRMIYSFEAKRKFRKLMEAAKPDLVHIHNIYHQLSPSFLSVAKGRGVPVVMTAHDYKLVSPNYSMYHDGEICEHAKGDVWKAYRHKCVKGSAMASWLVALEMSLHKRWGSYENNIDRIIAPSRFMQSTLVDWGVAEDKVVHVPHFIDTSRWTPAFGAGNYALYVGRLSPEKGVDTLIRAAVQVPDVPVRIVGAGPEEERLHALVDELGAVNVQFVGFKDGDALRAEYAGARFVVVPSVWYEVFGLIVLEAYAAGKPVIVSQMGGLPELVIEKETGVCTSAGKPEELAERMRDLWTHPDMCVAMGEAAREHVELDYSSERYYQLIMGVYDEVRQMHRK